MMAQVSCPRCGYHHYDIAMPESESKPAPLALWTRAEVAEFLGVTVSGVDDLRARRDGLPWKSVGKAIRFIPDEVMAWVGRQEGRGMEAAPRKQ